MNNIVIKTTPKLKQVLNEWNQTLSQKKGVRVLQYESDNNLADIFKSKIMKNNMNDSFVRPARGGRRKAEVIFKL